MILFWASDQPQRSLPIWSREDCLSGLADLAERLHEGDILGGDPHALAVLGAVVRYVAAGPGPS